MTGKWLFLPLEGSKSHAKYYFLTRGGPIHLPIKYRNFAQSPFKGDMWPSYGELLFPSAPPIASLLLLLYPIPPLPLLLSTLLRLLPPLLLLLSPFYFK